MCKTAQPKTNQPRRSGKNGGSIETNSKVTADMGNRKKRRNTLDEEKKRCGEAKLIKIPRSRFTTLQRNSMQKQ